jgi:hypothetical protein
VNYAYRSIAQFVKNVTNEQSSATGNPFPEFNLPLESSSDDGHDQERKKRVKSRKSPLAKLNPKPANENDISVHNHSDMQLFKDAATTADEQFKTGQVDKHPDVINGEAAHEVRPTLMIVSQFSSTLVERPSEVDIDATRTG